MFVKSHVTILNVNSAELPATQGVETLPKCIDINELMHLLLEEEIPVIMYATEQANVPLYYEGTQRDPGSTQFYFTNAEWLAELIVYDDDGDYNYRLSLTTTTKE